MSIDLYLQLNLGSKIWDCVTWVCEGPSVLKLLWLAMTQLYNKLEVEFLPVYQPNEDEQLDAELYANNIRRLMAEHLNIPLCDLSYDDFCQIRIACKYKLPAHEAAIYLNSLLQVMFALEHNRDQLSDEDKQAKWLQARLESMLNVCRRKPYLSRTEFTNIVFPTCQPNSKANYLLNLVAKHYTSPAYHLCTLQTGVDDVEAWEISRSDAAELLSFAFTLENDATVQLILDQAYLIRDSIISNNTRSNHSFNGISGDYLYEGLLSQLPDVANCYIYFDTEISKIFGRRRRPLIDSTSASESNLNTVISAPAIQMTNSLAAVNDTSIKSQKDLILTNFECIDITEVPLKESNCYADKIKDDIHLINNSLKDDLSINFRGRYSERGV
ncbi:Lysophosphatidylcholine acyltransferase [Schistosoma japonicum]|nr:Lysophosphatidylcholine acyltransferase [Schistosoma japonicum]